MITLYTLSIYNFLCKLYLNKTGQKKVSTVLPDKNPEVYSLCFKSLMRATVSCILPITRLCQVLDLRFCRHHKVTLCLKCYFSFYCLKIFLRDIDQFKISFSKCTSFGKLLFSKSLLFHVHFKIYRHQVMSFYFL
jgi:hypothetical protein